MHSWWALLALPAALLIGFAFSAVCMALTTYMTSWQDFDKITLLQLPMFLFSATFFPITRLPGGRAVGRRVHPALPRRRALPRAHHRCAVVGLRGLGGLPGRDGSRRAVRRATTARRAAADLSSRGPSWMAVIRGRSAGSARRAVTVVIMLRAWPRRSSPTPRTGPGSCASRARSAATTRARWTATASAPGCVRTPPCGHRRSRTQALPRDQPPSTWSPLEYACHVRDVHRVFSDRLRAMIDEDTPHYDNWDQDVTAVEDRYGEQDPATVADELGEAARTVAAQYDAVGDEPTWQRAGLRSDGSEFTVDTLGRYHLHDVVHHAWDVRDTLVP